MSDFYRYAVTDTANKYKPTVSGASKNIAKEQLNAYLTQVKEQGYIIFENVLNQEILSEIRRESERLLDKTGRNPFEGLLTQRIYSLISKTTCCNSLVEHPLILALLDKLMLPNYLLSQLQIINIQPGEKQQPIHYDDAFYRVPRPRPAIGAATVWAIDDFTAENGATVVIPQSHLWNDKTPDDNDKTRQVSVEMPAGSVVFFLGTLWHGGGANRSDKPRLAVTAQYCEPWVRQQENFSLSVPAEKVAQCSENIKRLLGYSIYGPFMGFVDGKHPKRLLEKFQ